MAHHRQQQQQPPAGRGGSCFGGQAWRFRKPASPTDFPDEGPVRARHYRPLGKVTLSVRFELHVSTSAVVAGATL
jgi:hypothetical protein